MREPFRSGVGRQNQIDLDRHGGRCRNFGGLGVCEERLGHHRKRGALDPHKLLSGGIDDCDARQLHRFGEHADDEKVVFDVVHAVVTADNLGLVNGTDDECRRMPVVLGRSG